MPTQPIPPAFDIGSVWPSIRGLNPQPVSGGEEPEIGSTATSFFDETPFPEMVTWGGVEGSAMAIQPTTLRSASEAPVVRPTPADLAAEFIQFNATRGASVDDNFDAFVERERRNDSQLRGGQVGWQSTSQAPIRVRRSRATPTFSIPYDQGLPDEQEDNEMRTVGQIFGRNPDVATVTPHPLIMGVHRVGVEIEVERFTNRRARLNYWNMVNDGSLRNNGQEFTFRGPLGGKDAFDAIAEIDTLLYTTKPDLNIRCSTHVHVDVRDMTVPQLKRLILAYAFYESFLFNQSGRYRMKSNFCMPLCVAEGLTNILTTSWGHPDEDFLFQVTERWDKYSAINLIPMRSYGSVEFRIAEGKSSKGQLLRLVNRFLALKELAIASDITDREFLDKLRDTDYRSIFQKGLSRQVVFTEEDFNTGWVIANDIAVLGKMR